LTVRPFVLASLTELASQLPKTTQPRRQLDRIRTGLANSLTQTSEQQRQHISPRAAGIKHLSSAASTPDIIILPISSGVIAIVISAESVRPSPNGTPGARRGSTAVMRASNIDGDSMMTAPSSAGIAKVQQEWGMQAGRRHRLWGMYGFHSNGVTASGVPLPELTHPGKTVGSATGNASCSVRRSCDRLTSQPCQAVPLREARAASRALSPVRGCGQQRHLR
jgi:hypothetical protein